MRVLCPPLDHLTMRLRIASLLLLVSLALVAAGCGSTSGPQRVLSIAESAKKTTAASTYRTETRISMTIPGTEAPVELVASGSVDLAARRQMMAMDMSQILGALGGSGASASDLQVDMVMDGLTVYMRMPFATGSLPGGKKWVKMSLAQVAKSQGTDLSSLMGQSYADPSQYLGYLTSVVGTVEEVGTEDVRGVSTTRVRGTLDLDAYVAGLAPAARKQLGPSIDKFKEMVGSTQPVVEAWVGDDDLVRRIAMNMSFGLPAGAAGGSSTEMSLAVAVDLFDFGSEVSVSLPPPTRSSTPPGSRSGRRSSGRRP